VNPVVVYGASGYTGRLVCEYLRHYHVPFVAAGRSEEKLKASMDANVPGIETANYEIAIVEHDVAELTDLFKARPSYSTRSDRSANWVRPQWKRRSRQVRTTPTPPVSRTG